MNILIIDSFTPEFIEELHALPLHMTYIPKAPVAQIYQELPHADILLLNSHINVDKRVVEIAHNLKLVIRAGVGMDHIDIEYLQSKDIRVVNTAGGNADAVGEQTVGMMLSLLHHINRADQQIRNWEWIREPNRGQELGYKTVGIIGYGNTGKAVAKRLSGFGCRILAYDKYVKGYGNKLVEEVPLEQIYHEAEIVSFHVPHTSETHYWGDRDFFHQFRHPIIVMNLARGKVVHLPALLEAMDEGKVVAAGLDVFENEKLDTLTDEQQGWYEDLFSRDNVVMTPHVGGWTIESRENIQRMIKDYIIEMIDDKFI